ncbi:MAG: 4Fe-4S dicluster domain-containing protein [Planctomycetota bacterium]|nr:MAG: 4Fe-4S dicluster domain-containing protein [Planctomycetota bacterium]
MPRREYARFEARIDRTDRAGADATAEVRARSARGLRAGADAGGSVSTTAATPVGSDRSLVDYAKSLDCIHCGLCLRTCPTYQLTGVESSSPRGRIHLMRAVAEGRANADADFAEEMDFCLLCRHCESACPAGVRFGEMMEHTRGALAATRPQSLRTRFLRWLGFRVALPHRFALSLAAAGMRAAQSTGLWPAIARPFAPREAGLEHFPKVPSWAERRALPRSTPARGERVGAVAMLEGCVMPQLYGRVNRATVASLAALGFDVHVPAGQTCCGSLHAHNGDVEGARALAKRTIDAFDGELPLVVNSAGCGSHLRALHHLFEPSDPWHARAAALAKRVRDYSEIAATRIATAQGSAAGALAGPLAYDDPCHLCHGQQIRSQPRVLLDAACRAAGIARVELPDSESCCGSAGIYSVLRPADSQAILDVKLATLARSGARTLVTANPGCQLQWEQGIARAGLDVRVLHVAEVVERAFGAGVSAAAPRPRP